MTGTRIRIATATGIAIPITSEELIPLALTLIVGVKTISASGWLVYVELFCTTGVTGITTGVEFVALIYESQAAAQYAIIPIPDILVRPFP